MTVEPLSPRKAPGDRVDAQRLSEIVRIRPHWLWQPYIQRSALNFITGEPGTAKSTLCCEIAAILSTGRPWPNEEPSQRRPAAKVWICNGEDGAADTIAWRLGNQGANPDNVFVTDQAKAITPGVVAHMEEMIREHDIAAVFIDPLQAWIGGSVDMNRANETREWSSKLRAMAMRTGCAVIFVRHRRKAGPNEKIGLNSGLGSIDLSGIARSEIGISMVDELRVMSRMKGNIGKTGGGIAYSIDDPGEPGNDHGVLNWRLEVDTSILVCSAGRRTQSRTPRALVKAQQWLVGYLSSGPKPAITVYDAARAAGITDSTLKRAKKGIVAAFEIAPRDWVWELVPTIPSETPNSDAV